jgi:hypothetical protein
MADEFNIEIWRPIKGYEGLYSISNFGRVKSEDRIIKRNNRFETCNNFLKGRILRPGIKSNGYLFVGLSKDNFKKYRMVHTLVVEAFIGDRPHGMDVSHEDNNKANNHISNLCYKTHHENVLDRAKHVVERQGETVPTAVLSELQVINIRAASESGITNKALSEKYGICIGQIRKIVKRKQWRHI